MPREDIGETMTTPESQQQQPSPPPSGYGYYPPPLPQKRPKWPWLILGPVAFFFVIAIATGDGDTPATSSGAQRSPVAVQDDAPGAFGIVPTNADVEGDVKVTKCDMSGNAIGMADIEVRITNSTSRVQSYLVTVSVNDAAGNRLTEANGASNSVRPGQAATAELLASAVDGAASCAVANVTRIPS